MKKVVRNINFVFLLTVRYMQRLKRKKYVYIIYDIILNYSNDDDNISNRL